MGNVLHEIFLNLLRLFFRFRQFVLGIFFVMTNKCIEEVFPLTNEQKEQFLKDGVLVVDNVFSEEQINQLRQGLHETLKRHGIDHENIEETAHHLKALSSTNGSGGVLDIFYPR